MLACPARSTRSRCYGRRRVDEGSAVRGSGRRDAAGQAGRRADRRRRAGAGGGLRAHGRGLGRARAGRRRAAADGGGDGCCTRSSRRRSSPSASTTATTPRSRELDIPAVPVVFAKWSNALTGHEAPIVDPPARRRARTSRARSRWCSGAASTGRGEDEARRRSAGSRRSTTCPAAAPSWRRRCASSRWARASTRSRRSGPAIARADGVDLADIDIDDRGLGRADAVVEHAQPDLPVGGADRVLLAGHDAGGRAT